MVLRNGKSDEEFEHIMRIIYRKILELKERLGKEGTNTLISKDPK